LGDLLFLKSRCGWRDTPEPGGVNVNIHGGPQGFEERKAEEEKQRKLISLLTVDERRQYLELMERAARRQREGMPAIEVRPLTVEEIEAEAAELQFRAPIFEPPARAALQRADFVTPWLGPHLRFFQADEDSEPRHRRRATTS